MNRKKPEPLPADPAEALAEATGLIEDLKAQAEKAEGRADHALDEIRDCQERLETLFHRLDVWHCDRPARAQADDAPAAPTAIGEFERVAGDAPRFMSQPANRLAVVERTGNASFAPWGFVIWEEGLAVKGQASGSWTADEACRRAKEWMARNPEDPR